jgi:hypothetical protein
LDLAFLAQDGEGVTARLLPEVTPFPSAQIGLSRLRTLSVEQIERTPQIASAQCLQGNVHVRGIRPLTGGQLMCFSPGPRRRFTGLGRQSFSLGVRRSHRLPGADDNAEQQRRNDGRTGGKQEFVATNEFLKAIGRTRGASREAESESIKCFSFSSRRCLMTRSLPQV